MAPEESVGVIFHFLIPVVLCWGGYRIFVPRRQQISHGNVGLMPQRLFWQMLLPSAIFLVLSQFAEYLGLHPRATGLIGIDPFSLRSLITFQALMVGCLTGVPLCYFLLRIIRNPLHIRGFISQIRLQIDPKIKRVEFIFWALTLLMLLVLLLIPLSNTSTIFSTNYTLSLLMPVMLWGAMRFGYRFIAMVWTPVLILIIHFHDRYLPFSMGYNNQLAITSSSYLVFLVYYRLYGHAGDAAAADPRARAANGVSRPGGAYAEFTRAKPGPRKLAVVGAVLFAHP
ncbi:Cyclic di-GMP phosphodiesterase YfgF [Raoultella terrigena]|uniref:Cyclic di-GMP phosphodiesterase YfgF n=1 Tax=Raoultella terrigena TaxID=577 RepID=A0A4U9D3S1_RAOTE|nr:Cyclic di-GMP phosphodiesterase YfgF [Raoultella terrigena]